MTRFETAIAALNNSANAGKPLAIAKARETAICNALVAMAAEMDVTLQKPSINSLGEIPVFAVSPDIATRVRGACGPYGDAFVAWLNRIPVRTGMVSTQGHVLPQNGWCWVNHFDAERLVRLYADKNKEAA